MAYNFNYKGKNYIISNKDDVKMWIADLGDPLGMLESSDLCNPVRLKYLLSELDKGNLFAYEYEDADEFFVEIFLPFTAEELEERSDSEAYLRSWVF